jgi:hypothetical protein
MSEIDYTNARCMNNSLLVRFEDNLLFELGDTGIILQRAEQWLARDRNGEIRTNEQDGTSKYEYNVDCRETHPQICKVLASNENYPYKKGDRLFCHYMAFESAKDGDIVTLQGIINADFVFFTIRPDGELIMADDIFIGEPIINDEVITKSGILAELGKKDLLKVKITHAHKPYYKRLRHDTWERSQYLTNPVVEVGDIAVSVDQYNYDFEFNKKKYIKLKGSEIAGIWSEGQGLKPIAGGK